MTKPRFTIVDPLKKKGPRFTIVDPQDQKTDFTTQQQIEDPNARDTTEQSSAPVPQQGEVPYSPEYYKTKFTPDKDTPPVIRKLGEMETELAALKSAYDKAAPLTATYSTGKVGVSTPQMSNNQLQISARMQELQKEIEYQKDRTNPAKEVVATRKLQEYIGTGGFTKEHLNTDDDQLFPEYKDKVSPLYAWAIDPDVQAKALKHVERGGLLNRKNIEVAEQRMRTMQIPAISAQYWTKTVVPTYGDNAKTFVEATMQKKAHDQYSINEQEHMKLVLKYEDANEAWKQDPDNNKLLNAKAEAYNFLINSKLDKGYVEMGAGRMMLPEKASEQQIQTANEINATMDEYQSTPRSKLKELMGQKFMALQQLDIELKKSQRQSIVNRPTMIPGQYAELPSEMEQENIERNMNPKINYIKDLRRKVATEFEAASRLYYLNENPAERLNTRTWGDVGKEFLKGLLPKDMAQNFVHSTITEQKAAFNDIYETSGVNLTEEERKKYDPSFADQAWEGLGGATKIGAEFALAGIPGRTLGLAKWINEAKTITPVAYLERARSAGDFAMTLASAKKFVNMGKRLALVADLVHQGIQFEVISEDPENFRKNFTEGVIFGGTMHNLTKMSSAFNQIGATKKLYNSAAKVLSKVQPPEKIISAMNTINRIAWLQPVAQGAKSFLTIAAKDAIPGMIKTDASLFVANNTIKMGKALTNALWNNESIQYELNKQYGEGNDVMKNLALELTSGLAFGMFHLPERIYGIKAEYKRIAEEQRDYYEDQYQLARYFGMTPEAEVLKSVLIGKEENLKYFHQKRSRVKAVQKAYQTVAKKMTKLGEEKPEEYFARRDTWSKKHRILKQELIKKAKDEMEFTPEENDLANSYEFLMKNIKKIVPGIGEVIPEFNGDFSFEHRAKFMADPEKLLNKVKESIQEVLKESQIKLDEMPRITEEEQRLYELKLTEKTNRERDYRLLDEMIEKTKTGIYDKDGNLKRATFDKISNYYDKATDVLKSTDVDYDLLQKAGRSKSAIKQIYSYGDEVAYKTGEDVPEGKGIIVDDFGGAMVRIKHTKEDPDENAFFVNRKSVTDYKQPEPEKQKENETKDIVTEITNGSITGNKEVDNMVKSEGYEKVAEDYLKDINREILDLKSQDGKEKEIKELEDQRKIIEDGLNEYRDIEKTKEEGKKKKAFTILEKDEYKTTPSDDTRLDNGEPKSTIVRDRTQANRKLARQLKIDNAKNDHSDPASEKIVKKFEQDIKNVEENKLVALLQAEHNMQMAKETAVEEAKEPVAKPEVKPEPAPVVEKPIEKSIWDDLEVFRNAADPKNIFGAEPISFNPIKTIVDQFWNYSGDIFKNVKGDNLTQLESELFNAIKENPDFNVATWLREKFVSGELKVDLRMNSDEAKKFDALSPDEQKEYVRTEIPLKNLPEEIQKSILTDLDNFMNGTKQKEYYSHFSKILKNWVKGKEEKPLSDQVTESSEKKDDDGNEDPTLNLLDQLKQIYEEINDSERVVDEMTKTFTPIYNKMSDAGIKKEKETLIKFIRDYSFKEAGTSKKKLKAFLDEIIKSEGDSDYGKIAKILRNGWDHSGIFGIGEGFNYDQMLSLIDFESSLNPVRYIAFNQLSNNGGQTGLSVYYMNQADNQEEFLNTFKNHVDNHIEFANAHPEYGYDPKNYGEADESYNTRLLIRTRNAGKEIANRTIGLAKNYDEAVDQFSEVLNMFTGISKDRWKQYFTLETERFFIRHYQKTGAIVMPNIIGSAFIGNNGLENTFVGVKEAFIRYFTKGDLNNYWQDNVDNDLIKLANVINESSYYYNDKDLKTKPAVEQDSYLTAMFKQILGPKYQSEFYKNNPVVQFYRNRNLPIPLVKIGKIFGKLIKGTNDIAYDDLQERDIERTTMHLFFDSPKTDSYQMLHRIYSGKKQLYLIDVPKYENAVAEYEKIYNALSENIKKSKFYATPDEVRSGVDKMFERFKNETRIQYPHLYLAAAGEDALYEIKKGVTVQIGENSNQYLGTPAPSGVNAAPVEPLEIKKAKVVDKIKTENDIKDGLLNFRMNYAINSIHLDQLILGDIEANWFEKGVAPEKQNLDKIRGDINKRLGSANSCGMAGVYSSNPEDGLSLPFENHLVIQDTKVSDFDKLPESDGALYASQEWLNRYAKSMGSVINKVHRYGSMQNMKGIYFESTPDGKISITKGNRLAIDDLAKLGSPEQSKFKAIVDLMTRYNEGKEWKDQIHSVSFGPSTTKKSRVTPLDLFDATGVAKTTSIDAIRSSIEQRDLNNLLYQQDLRNEINPTAAKNPIQKKNNLAFFDKENNTTKIESDILDKAFGQAEEKWNELIASDEKQRLNPTGEKTGFRKFILEMINKDLNPEIWNYINSNESMLDIPYYRKYLLNYVINKMNSEYVQNTVNRVALQEIPNLTGHDLRSVRSVSKIHINGDAELGIEANPNHTNRRLLPEADGNIGASIEKGSYLKELTGLWKKNINVDPYNERRYGKWFEYKEGERKNTFETARSYANRYNDLHEMSEDQNTLGKIGKLDLINIEEVVTGPNGEAGTYFYVPGELVDLTRVPGHDIQSHPMARLRKPIGEKGSDLSRANYVMLPWDLISSGGSDFDGDKRYAEALYTRRARPDQDYSPSNMVSHIVSDDYEVKKRSANNIIMMLRAQKFSQGEYGDLLSMPLDKNKFQDIMDRFSTEKMPQNTPESLLETYRSNRLLSNTISDLVSINGVYDTFKKLGVDLKFNTSGSGTVTTPIQSISFPSESGIKTIAITGFSKDEFHMIKETIGVLENIALDNKDGLYKLGLNEHTSSIFVTMLFGDKSIDNLKTKEEVDAAIKQRVSDIADLMHSPLMVRFTEEMRKSKNLGEEVKFKQILNNIKNGPGALEIINYFKPLVTSEISDPLQKAIDGLHDMYYAGKDIMKVYNLLKKNNTMAKNFEEYVDDIMSLGKIYFNDFTYLNMDNFYSNKKKLTDAEKLSKMQYFFGKKSENGEFLDYLVNPEKYFELEGINPFVKGVVSSFKMSAKVFSQELEMSSFGRQILARYVSLHSGKENDPTVVNFGNHGKYFTKNQAKEFAKSLNSSVLAISQYKGGKSTLSRINSINNMLINYKNTSQATGSINDFLEMIELGYVGGVKKTNPLDPKGLPIYEKTAAKIQLLKAFHHSKISREQLAKAQNAFDKLLSDEEKNDLITYMVQKYGSSSSTWGGSYFNLIPMIEKQKLGMAFSTLKERIMKGNVHPIERAQIQTYFDYFSKIDNSADKSFERLDKLVIPLHFDPNALSRYYFSRLYNKDGFEVFVEDGKMKMRGIEGPDKDVIAAFDTYADKNNLTGQTRDNKFVELTKNIGLKNSQTEDLAFFDQAKENIIARKMFVRLIEQQQETTTYEKTKKSIELIKKYKANSDLQTGNPGRNIDWGTEMRGTDEYVKIAIGAKKYPAKVIAKRLSKRFGIKVVFADLGTGKSQFIPGKMDLPIGFKGTRGEKKVTKAMAKHPALVVLNTRNFDRIISSHEYLHPFYEYMTAARPTLAREWSMGIQVLAHDNPVFANIVDGIIATKTGKARDGELFSYFVSHMIQKDFKNKTVIDRLKSRLIDLFDFAFDGLGIPLGKPVDKESLVNYSLQDVADFFNSRKRLDLSDFDYSSMLNYGSSEAQKVEDKWNPRTEAMERMIFQTLRIENELKKAKTPDIMRFENAWHSNPDPSSPDFAKHEEYAGYPGVVKIAGKLVSKAKGVFETPDQFVRNSALREQAKVSKLKGVVLQAGEYFDRLRSRANRMDRDEMKSEVEKTLDQMMYEYGWNEEDLQPYRDQAGNDVAKLRILNDLYQDRAKNLNSQLHNIINDVKLQKSPEEIKQKIYGTTFANSFSDKQELDNFVDNLLSVISVYMPTSLVYGSKDIVLDPHSGMYDFVTFAAPNGQGQYNIIKFRITNRKFWNADGTVYTKQKKSLGFFGEQKEHTITPLRDTWKDQKFDVTFEKMDYNKENQFFLSNATTAALYENVNNAKVDRVIEIPLQINIDHESVNPNYSGTETIKSVDVITGRDAQGQMTKPFETKFDDRVREMGNRVLRTAERIKNIQYKEEFDDPDGPRGIYEGMLELHDPDMNLYGPKIGAFSKIAVLDARRFLVQQFGKPLSDITNEDMLDKCSYIGAGRLTNMLSKGFSYKQINSMGVPELLLYQTDWEDSKRSLFIGDKNNINSITQQKLRSAGYNVTETDWKNAMRFIYGSEGQIPLMEKIRYKMGLPDNMTGVDIINALSKNKETLSWLRQETNKFNREATSFISDFIDQSQVANEVMESIISESRRGYAGPRIATILVSEMFKNSPELFRDFKAALPKWDLIKYMLFFYPKAFIGVDTRPAQFVIHLASQAQIRAKNEWMLKKDRLDEVIKNVGDVDQLITTDPLRNGEHVGGHYRWITKLEASIQNRPNLTSEQRQFVDLIHDFETEYNSHITGFNSEETPIPVQWNYQRLLPIMWANKMHPRRSAKIRKALEPGVYDSQHIMVDGNDITFAQFKYHNAGIDNWYKAAIAEKEGVKSKIFDDLLHVYEAAKKDYVPPQNGVDEFGQKFDYRKIQLKQRQFESIAAVDSRGDFQRNEILNALHKQVQERVLQKVMGDIIPFYKVFGMQYKTTDRNGELSEKNIEKYLNMVVKHDVYGQTIDDLKSMPWLKNFIDNAIKWAAWWGISFNLHNQIYNIKTGVIQDFINEPMMMLDTIMSVVGVGRDINQEGKSEWGFGDHHWVNMPFINRVMRVVVPVGISPEQLSTDPWSTKLGTIQEWGFKPVTVAERFNQGLLIQSYLKQIRPGKDISAAYDKDMNVIDKDLALQPWELEQMKNLVEGVHGYYGLSRAPYSYFVLGRAVGLFRFPWMTAQFNNMFGKFKIDATQMERVGYLRGSLQAIRAVYHYLRATNEELKQEYSMLADKSIDDYKLLDYMLNRTQGLIEHRDEGLFKIIGGNRWKTAMKNLPNSYKKTFISSILFTGAMFALSYFLKEALFRKKQSIMGDNGRARNIADLSRREAVEHQDALIESQNLINLLGDIAGPGPLVAIVNNPTALLNTWQKLYRSGKDLYNETAVLGSRVGLLDKMTEKEMSKKLHFDPSNGSQWYQPTTMFGGAKVRKSLYNLALLAPYGLGNIFSEYQKWTRANDIFADPNHVIFNAGKSWEERKRLKEQRENEGEEYDEDSEIIESSDEEIPESAEVIEE